MKRLMLFFTVLLLFTTSSVLSQTLSNYIKEVKGDTLVIKDYSDMNDSANSLYWSLTLDSVNVPAGRVYELQAGGWYPLLTNPTTSPKQPTVIVGSDPTMVVDNKDTLSSPPLISGYSETGATPNTAYINAGGDLTIKNCTLTPGAPDSTLGWAVTGPVAPDLNLVYDNCIFEHVRWVFINIQQTDENCNLTLRNCYFVNVDGQPCRRNGGIFDCFANTDTLLAENCTFINAQGTMFRFRSGPAPYGYDLFKRITFNHNTFIDCAGSVFMNSGYQSNVSLTNNMFINCNVQPYPGIHSIDPGEQDPDWLPMGLVNVYPDSADVANNTPRRFLCEDNLAYWDPSLADIDSIEDANKVDGVTNWRSQMIIMNSRTDSVFKHIRRFNTPAYSYCITDTWKNQMPHFTNPEDLFGDRLAILKSLAVAIVDTNSAAMLPNWRLVSTGPNSYLHPDWPIPVDLSYSDADLKTAGLGGFPLGDLNWFPTQKKAWLAQRSQEYAAIAAAMGDPTAVQAHVTEVPASFQLEQNYPNPFNPSTEISYQLPSASNVTLRVYDVLGREVATLVNGRQNAGTHIVRFDGSSLSSGVYFYRLRAGNYTATKKLLLLK